MRRPLALLAVAVALVVASSAPASAHPLGNFTVNRYAGLRMGPERVVVDYVVDMAEVPTVQVRPEIDRDGDGDISGDEETRYEDGECGRYARNLRLDVDGQRLAVHVRKAKLAFPPGEAGLLTLRLECRLAAATDTATGERTVGFADTNFAGRIGWREVTAVGDGATLVRSDVPETSVSGRLADYPDDRLGSPPSQRTATVRFRPGGGVAPAVDDEGGGAASPSVGGLERLTESFTDAVAERDLTLGFGLVALAIGIALGAVHAVVPGHGKTVMAAYLVGEQGRTRDGLLIGVTVAITHTVGVLALGLFLTASQAVAPERVYPWLTVTSGVLFAGLGVGLLVRALRRRRSGIGAGHHHGAFDHLGDHGHGHHAHGHDHHHDQHHHHWGDGHAAARAALSRRDLVTLGVAGGLVPTPSAVVVILGATAIGRAWFGVVLVLAYGVGMAITLVGAGLLLAYARRRFDLRARGERLLRWAAFLPLATSLVVITSGLVIMARGITSA